MTAAIRIWVGTEDGLHEFDTAGGSGATHHAGRAVTALGAEYPDLWAILDGTEVWKTSSADGWTLKAALDSGLRANVIADTRAGYLVGTSEAHLFRVAEAGLERVDPFEHVEGRDDWYTPWGGPPDSRSISEDSNTVYVNVHVGGVVRSKDEGVTWEPTIDVDADVHRVWAADRAVFAACARGLAVSEHRGDSWTYRTEGMHAAYCRAVALCGDVILVSASTGPRGGSSALYRGAAAGGAFERCRTGLPDWFEDNIDSLCLDAMPREGAAAFGTQDGRVFASQDQGASWAEVASGLPAVRCVLVMPG